jgi:hypothetical protein
MRELALHILDLAENSVSAQAKNISIRVLEDTIADRMKISIQDDGKGMDPEMVEMVIDPFVTSRTTRKVGLGIPLLKEAAELCNGDLTIISQPGHGTLIAVDLQLEHIDRMPLGDLADTYLSLMVAHPEVHWIFDYQVVVTGESAQWFYLDDQPVKDALEGLPLCDPTVLAYLRGVFQDGINSMRRDDIQMEINL